MQRLQAYRFELRPSGFQARQLRCFAGACRLVFNRALAIQRERHAQGLNNESLNALSKRLTGWRNDSATPWLAQAPVHPQQQALRDLRRAYANFFAGRACRPRFRRKWGATSFRYPDAKQFKVDQANRRMFLPKLGWVRYRVRYRNSRGIEGTPKNLTLSLCFGRSMTAKWFVSVQTKREVPAPGPRIGVAGIDLGVARFATLSDGSFHVPLNSFKRHETALRKANQRLSRKVKFSSNWRKAKAHLQRVHHRRACVRKDTLHKASTEICKNHAIVSVEDLKGAAMTASAKGTAERPGKNVRGKAGLNQAILDQGWFEFRRQLGYKAAWNGGRLVAVPAAYTSQECSACGHTAKANRRSQECFVCTVCGFEKHADWNAAINIRRAGLARIACEVSGSSRQQQEPTKATWRRASPGSGAVGIPVV